MSLSVDSRHCGKVYVITCVGRIVAGEESTVLETAVTRGVREFTRVVLHVGEVSRVDSTGMGLLVRFLTHTRSRGGDFRLASPPPFLTNLLSLTKLSSVFRVYDSEDDAIVSFLKGSAVSQQDAAVAGPKVLFVDQSADLCAFVRSVLHHHGYEVLSTCRVHDAKTLLTAANVDYIVLGPDSSRLPSDSVLASLRPLAPKAATVLLQSEFKHQDAEHAGVELLRMMQAGAPS